MATALLIIDMQNDYFPGGRMELTGIEEAAENCAALLKTFRNSGQPVFHVQHLAVQPGASFFLPETDGVQIHSSLRPLENEMVVVKHYPSAFRETRLEELLRTADIEQLVICGAMSHMCIDTTTRAAFDLNFSCLVAADGCATRDLGYNGETIPAHQVHGAYMAALGAVFARVSTSAEIIDTLAR